MKKLSAYLLLLSLIIIFISACGSSDDTPPVTPSPPSILGVQLRAEARDGQVTLYWPMVNGANTYKLYYSSSLPLTKASGTPITGLISAPYTVGIHTGEVLNNGTTYYFAFSAVNTSTGESDLSDIIPATPQSSPIPPEFPKNVRANAGDGKVTVTWTPVVGADHYTLYCMWLSGAFSVSIGGITIPGQATNSKVVDLMTWITGTGAGTTTGLTNGILYSFSLMAETAETGPSTVISATPGTASTDTDSGGTAAATVTATVTAETTGQVIISWEPLVSATANTSYNIYYYPTAAGSTVNDKKIPGATSPWQVSGLPNGTPYSFYLTSDTASSISFAALATPSTTPPPMAPVLEPPTLVDSTVTLTWNVVTATPDVTSYYVYVGTAQGVTKNTGAPSLVSDLTPPLTTDATLPTGTYYIVVTAVNANGESTESNEVSVTVP